MNSFTKSKYWTSAVTRPEYKKRQETRFLKRIKYYGEAPYLVCMILDPLVHDDGITKSGFRLEIQHTIALALHLFPDKDVKINCTFLVEINNYMGNKHAFANKASWAGLKEYLVPIL